jgi:hypothetical protein
MNNSTGPYFDERGKPVVRNSIIVCTDIMGYKEAIQNFSRDKSQWIIPEMLHLALSDAVATTDDRSQTKSFRKMSADSILVAYPLSINGSGNGADEFCDACFRFGQIQLKTTMEWGTPIRGGVICGQIHLSDLLMFPSEAVLAEMNLVERVAVYPRIVLMDSAQQFLSENGIRFSTGLEHDTLLWTDFDGATCVNYLRPLAKTFLGDWENRLTAHRQFIEGRLEQFRDNIRIRGKYFWMARYHNRFCESYARLNSEKYKVDSVFF